MKNDVNPDLWEPIVTKHPDLVNTPPQPSAPYVFNPIQEDYEKYEVPGIMPAAPNRHQKNGKSY